MKWIYKTVKEGVKLEGILGRGNALIKCYQFKVYSKQEWLVSITLSLPGLDVGARYRGSGI